MSVSAILEKVFKINRMVGGNHGFYHRLKDVS